MERAKGYENYWLEEGVMYTAGWKHLANKCVAFHGCDIRIPNTRRLPFSEIFSKCLNFPQIKKKIKWER